MSCSNQVEIDVFSSKYQEGILNLIVNIQQEEFGIAITAKDQPDLCNIQSFYQKDKGNFWVAVLNEKAIGTISLLDIGNEQAALRKMFVSKEYRGGTYHVASMLLEKLFKWARLNKVKEIFLGTTSNFLAVHRFYEKNGFNEIVIGTLPSAFPIMKVDTKFYKFEL
ncbi:MAG: GNAT family N-acetyltransferase [Deltaproteobacteria bacterium]|nr:GNAT family N-acetyltransferase [Deltaproteobacteria bacterium]